MDEFKIGVNKYNYLYQHNLTSKETKICRIPVPKNGVKSVKNITWYADEYITVYATMSNHFDGARTVWEELKANTALSPCVTAMKFVNTSVSTRPVIVRVIME